MKFVFCFVLANLFAAPVMAAPANDATATSTTLWFKDRQLSASANTLLAEMHDAEKYGLRARDYGADTLLARARACRRMRNHVPNLIAVDFYRRGQLFRVAKTLNDG